VVNVVLAGPLSGEIGAGALENVLERKRKRRRSSEEGLRIRSNGMVSEERSRINKRREQEKKQRTAKDEKALKKPGLRGENNHELFELTSTPASFHFISSAALCLKMWTGCPLITTSFGPTTSTFPPMLLREYLWEES
jgi:hypothetical protein